MSSPTSFDPNRHLCRDDIKFPPHQVVKDPPAQRPPPSRSAAAYPRLSSMPRLRHFAVTLPWFPPQISRRSSALLLVAPCVL